MQILKGKKVWEGQITGTTIVSHEPMSFLEGIDPKTGIITMKGHELEGKCIKDKILVFPHGAGSTVGSYAIYQLKKNNAAPIAMIVEKAEPIVAVGAIISEIPMMHHVNISKLKTNMKIKIDTEKEEITIIN